jgi:hypothetical protein
MATTARKIAGLLSGAPKGGDLPLGLLGRQGSMSSYTPTMREKMAAALAKGWFGDTREGYKQANRLVNVGETVVPPLGLLNMSYDAGRTAGGGNMMQAGIEGGMAMLPLPGKFKHEVGAYLRDVSPGALNGLTRQQNRARNKAADNGEWIEAEIPIHNIYGTQAKVNSDFADVPKNNSSLPFVVKVNGKFFAQDGHHRLVAAAAKGSQTAKVRLVDLDGTTDLSTPLLDWAGR